MKKILFACTVLFACKPGAKSTSYQKAQALDPAVREAYYKPTIYKMTGTFAADTTVKK
jgi:hypothetical protein